MKCGYCNSEWSVNPGLSLSVTKCPFCGKPLQSEKKAETVEEVLTEIKLHFGTGVFADGKKLAAYFSDLAPQLSRQRRMLDYFVECNGPQKIMAVQSLTDHEQKTCIMRIVREMKEEMFIEETASRMICESFLFAVTGKRISEHAAENNHADQKEMPAQELNPEEQFLKGKALYDSVQEENPDFEIYQKACEWFRKAAERGYAPAQHMLGKMYVYGRGVPKDSKTAAYWYDLAAKQGDSTAQFRLGMLYESGDGIPKDAVKAASLYKQSADQGNSDGGPFAESLLY